MLICFGSFSQLITFSISAVACRRFVAVGSAVCQLESCPERSREAKTDVQQKVQTHMFLKRNVCHHFAARKTGRRHLFYVPLIQIIVVSNTKKTFASFLMNFGKRWQTCPLGKMLANVPPPSPPPHPKSGGLIPAVVHQSRKYKKCF